MNDKTDMRREEDDMLARGHREECETGYVVFPTKPVRCYISPMEQKFRRLQARKLQRGRRA